MPETPPLTPFTTNHRNCLRPHNLCFNIQSSQGISPSLSWCPCRHVLLGSWCLRDKWTTLIHSSDPTEETMHEPQYEGEVVCAKSSQIGQAHSLSIFDVCMNSPGMSIIPLLIYKKGCLRACWESKQLCVSQDDFISAKTRLIFSCYFCCHFATW